MNFSIFEGRIVPCVTGFFQVHPCNSHGPFCICIQKASCRSNTANLVFGHFWRTKKCLDYGRDIMLRAYGFSKIPWLGAALWLAGMARSFAQAVSPGAAIELPEVEVVATSPLPSGGENRDNIPAMVPSVPRRGFRPRQFAKRDRHFAATSRRCRVDRRQRQSLLTGFVLSRFPRLAGAGNAAGRRGLSG